MNILVREPYDRVQRTLGEVATRLGRDDYRDLLEELVGHLEACLEGIKDDQANDD